MGKWEYSWEKNKLKNILWKIVLNRIVFKIKILILFDKEVVVKWDGLVQKIMMNLKLVIKLE